MFGWTNFWMSKSAHPIPSSGENHGPPQALCPGPIGGITAPPKPPAENNFPRKSLVLWLPNVSQNCNFPQKNELLFCVYVVLTSWKKSEKSNASILRKQHYK